MKCTGKEWDSCRVEKMGHTGCYYAEADDVFKELGYEIDINCLGIIRYKKSKDDTNYYIKFYLDERFFDTNIILDNKILPLAIDIKLLSAINKKCKELGWIN